MGLMGFITIKSSVSCYFINYSHYMEETYFRKSSDHAINTSFCIISEKRDTWKTSYVYYYINSRIIYFSHLKVVSLLVPKQAVCQFRDYLVPKQAVCQFRNYLVPKQAVCQFRDYFSDYELRMGSSIQKMQKFFIT